MREGCCNPRENLFQFVRMQIDLPPEDDPRRAKVRAWLEEHPNPTGQQLAEAGYVVPHWPAPWGIDAEPELQLIIDDELRRAGVQPADEPDRHRSLRARSRRACERGAEGSATSRRCSRARKCGASCSASRAPDPIWPTCRPAPCATAMCTSINGQKIWTSLAQIAKFGILIARTDADVLEARGHLVLHHRRWTCPASRSGRSAT